MSTNNKEKKRKNDVESITNKRFKALLEEYDLEVSSKIESMKRYSESLEIPIKSVYWREITRLPNNIKKMPITVFCEKHGGNINSVIQSTVDLEIEEMQPKSTTKKIPQSSKKKKMMDKIESSKENNSNKTNTETVSQLLSFAKTINAEDISNDLENPEVQEALKNIMQFQNKIMNMKKKLVNKK